MLESVLDAVVTALNESGARAAREYPESAVELERGTLICVGAEKSECVGAGLGDYLGVKKGSGGEADRELYGRRLELALSFTVLAAFPEGVAALEEAADRLGALPELLPEGLRCRSLELGEVKTDEELGCFLREGRLSCTAYLVAESEDDEDAEFLDFRLKGTVKNVD